MLSFISANTLIKACIYIRKFKVLIISIALLLIAKNKDSIKLLLSLKEEEDAIINQKFKQIDRIQHYNKKKVSDG